MIIKSVVLQDFRGISTLDLPIDEKLTVIVGGNGVGKTSVLDAISHLLLGLRHLWISNTDNLRTLQWPSVEESDIALKKPDCSIRASVTAGNESDNLLTTSLKLGSDLKENFSAVHKLKPNPPTRLPPPEHPLFAYYRQDRGFSSKQSQRRDIIASDEIVRQQSLSKDLCAIPYLSTWWDKMDAQEARRHRDSEPGYRDLQLEAVRKLVKEMEEFEGISYEATQAHPGLYLHKLANQKIHVDQLSSGERVYLILLADLARRLQIIQPDALLSDIPGVILIDEIELNLHPKWQRKIIPTLTKVFSRCQFIVTTHSPQVLGGVNGENIRVLSRNQNHEVELQRCGAETFGRDSNEILIKILGASERDEDTKSKLEKLELLISNGELEQARELFKNIKSNMGSNMIELDIAEQRLRRRERTTRG